MYGTIAVTDSGWYDRLSAVPQLEEVNFWKPSVNRPFNAPAFSPFLFKLRSPHNAICGFGYFARYSRLPDWLAWETFGLGNGCLSLKEMQQRISRIRQRIGFQGTTTSADIGCILLVQPVFFPSEHWVAQPSDWSPRTQSDKRYDLSAAEGARVWGQCVAAAARIQPPIGIHAKLPQVEGPSAPRYGTPTLTKPRLGQGTFRICVTEAYGRACGVTEEHSLPALEASHIRPYADEGPHEVANGLLLRADLHRLFDRGYLTFDAEHRLVVSNRLRQDFSNGRSYYPLQGTKLRVPQLSDHQPAASFLQFHRENCFRG
jgi:putative restriction endonuclease